MPALCHRFAKGLTMLEKIGHIKNPLTVIAMFAGIAEVSGTIVLPMLSEQVQCLYVWFLMLFPCLLVALFFFTLWVKHTVLYAPSDFQDDKSFMEAHFKKKTEYSYLKEEYSEVRANLAASTSIQVAAEVQVEESQPIVPDLFGDANEHVEPIVGEDFRKRILDSSKHRVLRSLARFRHGISYQDVEPKQLPNVKFDGVVESPFSFDAVGFVLVGNDRNSTAVEDAYKKMIEARLFWKTLSVEERGRFSLHLALMCFKLDGSVSAEDLKKIQLLKTEFLFKVDVIEYTYDEVDIISKG